MHVAVIGVYGSAGSAVSGRLSDFVGSEVDRLSLIDGGTPGGLCILEGCMPSKAVLSSAMHAHDANEDSRVSAKASVDVPKTIEHKNEHIQSFAEHKESYIKQLSQQDGIELFEHNARFKSDGSLLLDNNEELNPDYVVLSTGSKVNVPSIQGISNVDYLTSADILDMEELPESVIVMGFGAIGMEMSAYLSAVGVDVTVIEHDRRPIDRGSNEIGDELLQIYRSEFGVEILTQTHEDSLYSTENGVKLELSGHTEYESVEADRLCLFTGRTPNTDGLGLENIGVETMDGWVKDNLQLKDNPSVFAAGDITGDRLILHIAKEQGTLSAENVVKHAKGEETEEFQSPEHIVYFTGVGKYPFAKYGVSADEARKSDKLLQVSRSASDDGIFKLKDGSKGMATLSFDKNTGEIKGYEGLHLHSDVMVKTMQVLIESNATVWDVPDRAYHPTTPEIIDGLLNSAKQKLGE